MGGGQLLKNCGTLRFRGPTAGFISIYRQCPRKAITCLAQTLRQVDQAIPDRSGRWSEHPSIFSKKQRVVALFPSLRCVCRLIRHRDQIPLVLSETSGIAMHGIGWPGAKTGRLVVSPRTLSFSSEISVAPERSASSRLKTAPRHALTVWPVQVIADRRTLYGGSSRFLTCEVSERQSLGPVWHLVVCDLSAPRMDQVPRSGLAILNRRVPPRPVAEFRQPRRKHAALPPQAR